MIRLPDNVGNYDRWEDPRDISGGDTDPAAYEDGPAELQEPNCDYCYGEGGDPLCDFCLPCPKCGR